MGQITLNREDSMRILANPDSAPDARVIAACAIAMFETGENAELVEPRTRSIALKLCHMSAAAIYDSEGS